MLVRRSYKTETTLYSLRTTLSRPRLGPLPALSVSSVLCRRDFAAVVGLVRSLQSCCVASRRVARRGRPFRCIKILPVSFARPPPRQQAGSPPALGRSSSHPRPLASGARCYPASLAAASRHLRFRRRNGCGGGGSR